MYKDKEIFYLKEILKLKTIINNIYDYCIECEKKYDGICISEYIQQLIKGENDE